MNKLVSATLASALGLTLVAPARAVTITNQYNFVNVGGSTDTVGDHLVNDFKFSVVGDNTNLFGPVTFIFNNNIVGTGNDPNIRRIGFNGTVANSLFASFVSSPPFTAPGTVSFNPTNISLPQVSWTTSNFDLIRSGNAATGVGPGEFLSVGFNLAAGKQYNDVISALSSNPSNFLGIHVTGITALPGYTPPPGENPGTSDVFVNTGDPIDPGLEVPEPTSILATALFGGFGLKSYLKKRKELQTTANEA